MKQEHLIAARLLHFLYDHIDHSKQLIFCPDGEASKKGVRDGDLADRHIPDLYWTFLGGQTPFAAEVKVVEAGKVSFCGDGEPRAWHSGGVGAVKPALWLGADEKMRTYYVWQHSAFNPALAALVGKGKTVSGRNKTLKATIPVHQAFPTAAQAAGSILAWAKHQPGMYP